MIGSIVLVVGLLLTLAGLAAARIPGGASASPGIGRFPRELLLGPIRPATWYANGSILLGFLIGTVAFAIIAALASTGVSVLIAGVGLVFIAAAIEGSRLLARIERWRAFASEPARPAPHRYRPLTGGFVELLRAAFLDESRWRDVLYAAVNFPLVVLELAVLVAVWAVALVALTSPLWYDLTPGSGGIPSSALGPLGGHEAAIVLIRGLSGVALLLVAAALSRLLMALHRGVVTALLCTSESRELRQQVETLRESRSAVLDVEASELSRIERDLHDGAQQRLVALTMDLGRASERLDSDPAAAKALILEGQSQAREALAEIRQLVRGIAPSILQDRGLVAALESIAGPGPVTTVVKSTLAPAERLSPAVERTAYFVASEALANVAKHSGASHCEVRVQRDGDRLVLEVEDDGQGGAVVARAGGLAGLRDRLAGVDGTLTVHSPTGGPTLVRAEIPLG